MKIGDVLVFTGNITGENHYDNFEIGKSYIISDITTIGYDMDDYTSESSICILFKDHSHGAIRMTINDYFLPLENYREQQINKIIK